MPTPYPAVTVSGLVWTSTAAQPPVEPPPAVAGTVPPPRSIPSTTPTTRSRGHRDKFIGPPLLPPSTRPPGCLTSLGFGGLVQGSGLGGKARRGSGDA